MGRAFSFLALLAAILLALYLAALAWLWLRQERLLFFPEVLPADHRLATDPDVRELSIPVPGAHLSVLHLQLPQPKGVVLYLHGNGGNLASWFTNAAFYRRANFDLVMPDYRGYGKSTGRIESAEQLQADVRAVWATVAERYRGQRVVVLGRSLGTALAADLAAQLGAQGRPPDLTVLVSPYTSMAALTAEYYPWVPRAVLRYPLDTAAHLARVRGPVLLLHGAQDTLIRVHHAQRLQALVPAAHLHVVQGAGHNDIHEFPLYQDRLAVALAQL
jgi:pimeloyl-ACP methyl ester carboxylesterase